MGGFKHLEQPIKPLEVEPEILTVIHDAVDIPVYWDGTTLSFTGFLRVDDDGTGSGHDDRYHQSDTSLHYQGNPLDADVDLYGVIPQQLIGMVALVVMGCQGYATWRGIRIAFVTGDAGPKFRAGEGSRALCRAFGVSDDPNSGGINQAEVLWQFIPGVPAVVNGKQYSLQAS